ncbi:MAG: hypothetical protein Q9181_003362 [Wetmoreana brouardii]
MRSAVTRDDNRRTVDEAMSGRNVMVCVAFGLLAASLSLFYYAYKQPHGAPTLPWSRSKKALITPEIYNNTPKIEDEFKEGSEVTDGAEKPNVQEINQSRSECEVHITTSQTLQGNVIPTSCQDGSRSPADADTASADKAVGIVEPKSFDNGGDEGSTTTMRPPARPGQRLRPKANDTMPAPPSPQSRTTSLRVPPTASTTLRPPPSAASILRTPPSHSQATLSPLSAPTASTLPSSNRPSRKVILEPGHSPLDWANLINNPPSSTYLRGSDVAPKLIRVPPSLVRYHNGRKGKNAWGVWQGKVYNLTPYMRFHPGGVDELMKGAGREKDAERLFLEVHPWVNWEGLLGECLIGILVSEEEANSARKGDSGLEDMD